MNRRWMTHGGVAVAAVFFVSLNILANETLSARRLDVTEQRLYTLSEGTRNILAGLTEPITLRYYHSQKAFTGVPALQTYANRIRDLLVEYRAAAKGRLTLHLIDPEPFSEAEDQAVSYGVTQLPLDEAGERGYLGLAGTNSADDEEVIPFFQPAREQSLEYDLARLIYKLANPKKRVIGVIGTLPVLGDPFGRGSPPWTVATVLREAFEVRDLGAAPSAIDQEVDTLLVIHPKELPEESRYAIDQFVLRGGKAMVFVDPYAEQDSPAPAQPGVLPKLDSDLPELFEKWGVRLVADKVATDPDNAIRVGYSGESGPREIEYLPWLRLRREQFNREDFATSELNTVNLASAGVLEPLKDAKTRFTPLLSTGPRAATLDRDQVVFARDPAALHAGYKPGDKPLVLAARVSGKVETAFPQGRPKKADTDTDDPEFLSESKEPVNVVVVADTDLLADRFWVQVQNFLGLSVPSAFADNANFVMNALEHLGGNNDLISLRSRGEYSRPFTRVEAVQREAEARYRDREQALQAKLEETERKINELQRQKEQGSTLLLSPEQKREVESFRREQLKTRKELRAVQHDLRKNIERLGNQLRLLNIGLVPVLIGLFGIGVGLARARPRDG